MRACTCPCSATTRCAAARSTALRSAHGYLQRRVADELRLKHTPTLEFVYDDTPDRAQRIDELLDREAGRRVMSDNGAVVDARAGAARRSASTTSSC